MRRPVVQVQVVGVARAPELSQNASKVESTSLHMETTVPTFANLCEPDTPQTIQRMGHRTDLRSSSNKVSTILHNRGSSRLLSIWNSYRYGIDPIVNHHTQRGRPNSLKMLFQLFCDKILPVNGSICQYYRASKCSEKVHQRSGRGIPASKTLH